MKKFVPVIVALAVAYFVVVQDNFQEPANSTAFLAVDEAAQIGGSTTSLVSGRQAQGSGTVTRVLPDDNDGSRHQRFILQLASGRTLLVAHNIDLAPRVAGIRPGDKVDFYGEFESNPQGGVIHWTHHDPNGQHVGGWLKHKGRTYQ
ncbi:MAG: DUF3465 domain-containing protein [Gammaproteobacteria bacterium]|jgi:hypothetical protein|nr:DUF3465 domain-containing protein [Gammaproteobacteria bacterium]